MFLYPEHLKAKATLWLWTLRDIGVLIGALVLSALALARFGTGLPLVLTALYAFLSIRVEEASILDFLCRAANFLLLRQQRYEWGLCHEP